VYGYLSLANYCNGLTECPITVFPFVRRQHAQFSWKQLFASSCLQIEHMHGCRVAEVVIFCCFDFASTYNHRATSGTPIMKKTIIVRTGILSTNRERPKQSVPIPSIESQRVVISIFITCCAGRLPLQLLYLIVFSFFYEVL
jgi:hypothetical protein